MPHESLVAHLGSEEPVLRAPVPPDPGRRARALIVALRTAIVAAAPKAGPDLVLGLLVDPEPPRATH